MPTTRQTMPQITLGYVADDMTGQPTWTLTVSDWENSAEPVKVSAETAAGIAQIVDVALPLPVDLNGEPTSAERLVRLAHVQTLQAQLATAQAGLKATSFTPTPPATTAGTDDETGTARPARARRTGARSTRTAKSTAAKGKAQTDDAKGGDAQAQVAPVVPIQAPPPAPADPVLETVSAAHVPDEPPVVDEPPHYSELPETLPRRPHLEVPAIEEF